MGVGCGQGTCRCGAGDIDGVVCVEGMGGFRLGCLAGIWMMVHGQMSIFGCDVHLSVWTRFAGRFSWLQEGFVVESVLMVNITLARAQLSDKTCF